MGVFSVESYETTMGRTVQHQSPENGDRSLASRVFGVGLRRETYANLAYLLARFPLGVVYFATFVAGLSIGLSLVPLVVGVPILAGVLALAGYVGVLEAHLLRGLRGSSVSYHPADPGDQPLSAYAKSVVTNPRNYLLVAYALASFVLGVHLFTAIAVVFTLALTLVAAPVLYWLPGVDYQLTTTSGVVDLGPLTVDASSLSGVAIDTLPEALGASVFGVIVCLVGLHAVNLTARLVGGLTGRLLGQTPK
jgi:hypothetical protein